MRRARREEIVQEIAEVRELQRLSAEARAGRAATVLRKKEEDLQEGIEKQQELEQNWQTSVTGSVFPVDMARLWSAALLRQDEHVRAAKNEVDVATEHLQHNLMALNAATRRHDEARENARKAASASLTRRDDERLAEVLDRHSQRGTVP